MTNDLNHNDSDVHTTNDHEYVPKENAGRNANNGRKENVGRNDYALNVNASEENSGQNTNNDCNGYGWERPRGINNFH